MKIPACVPWLVFGLTMAGSGARGAQEPLFEGLGSDTRKVTTASPEAMMDLRP